jgi:hypothetical protein
MRDLWRKDYGAIVANRAAISCVLNSAFVLFMLTKAIFSLFQRRFKPVKTTLDLPLFPLLAAFDKIAPPSTCHPERRRISKGNSTTALSSRTARPSPTTQTHENHARPATFSAASSIRSNRAALHLVIPSAGEFPKEIRQAEGPAVRPSP